MNKNEIDLLKLMRLFWEKKGIILAVTVILSFLASVFILHLKSVYQAKLTLIPPIENDLVALNWERSYIRGLSPILVNDAFSLYMGVLFAESTQLAFIAQQKKEALLNHQPDHLVSLAMKREEGNRHILFVNAVSIKAAKHYARKYLHFVRQQAQIKLKNSIAREVRSLKKSLKKQMIFLASKNASQAFQGELNSLERDYLRLKDYKPAFNDVVFARLDGKMLVSETYMRHKQKVLIVFSIMLSFIAGCVLMILRNFKSLLTVQA